MARIRFCDNCHNTGVICQSHIHRPWTGHYGCGCGDQGVRCPVCCYEPQEPDLSGVLEYQFRCDAEAAAGSRSRRTA